MLFSFLLSTFIKTIPLFLYVYQSALVSRCFYTWKESAASPSIRKNKTTVKQGEKSAVGNKKLETFVYASLWFGKLFDNLGAGSGSGGRTARSQHGFLHANGIRMSKDEKIAREVSNRSSLFIMQSRQV
jgi:hypothetical protein